MDNPDLERIELRSVIRENDMSTTMTDTKLTHPHCTWSGTTTTFEVNNMSDLLCRVSIVHNQDLTKTFVQVPSPTMTTTPVFTRKSWSLIECRLLVWSHSET